MNDAMKCFMSGYVGVGSAASDFVLNFNKKSWVHKWLCKQLLGRVVWYDLQQLIAAVLAKIEAQNEHPRN